MSDQRAANAVRDERQAAPRELECSLCAAKRLRGTRMLGLFAALL